MSKIMAKGAAKNCNSHYSHKFEVSLEKWIKACHGNPFFDLDLNPFRAVRNQSSQELIQ